MPKWCLSGLWCTEGNFAITMALAELAEQLQIDQLEIIERNRVHEGQELKILVQLVKVKRRPPFLPPPAVH
ncbi:hypothetical protein ACVXG9_19370 [Escherichia coli]